jgi:Alginate export
LADALLPKIPVARKFPFGGVSAAVILSMYCSSFVAMGQEENPPENTLIETPLPEAPSGPAWAMPLQALDETLPGWIQFNAQYRNRVEEAGHIGFRPGSDTYDLSQLRFEVAIQPLAWFRIIAEAQDAEIFFNNRVPSAPPYQNRWDLRQSFAELGSDKNGWIDVIAGRQMLSFGEERFVGPSDWLNQGRTFDVARVDLHHPGFRTSIFASSVVIARDGVIDHHLEGNNLYGVYNTLDKSVPKSQLEPFVFWRVAPADVTLSENEGRGALNEVTAGARTAGKLPASFDYDVEMALQRGSLGLDSIEAWGKISAECRAWRGLQLPVCLDRMVLHQ